MAKLILKGMCSR